MNARDVTRELLKVQRERDQLRAMIGALWNVLAKNDKLFNEANAAVDAVRTKKTS